MSILLKNIFNFTSIISLSDKPCTIQLKDGALCDMIRTNESTEEIVKCIDSNVKLANDRDKVRIVHEIIYLDIYIYMYVYMFICNL